LRRLLVKTIKRKKYLEESIEYKIDMMNKTALLFNETVKKCKFGLSTRQSVFLAYFDMSLEYVNSIYVLVQKNHYGVAAANVRLHLETLIRAIWVLRYASDDVVEKVNNDKFNFPSIAKLVKEIDEVWGTDNSFQRIKSNHWKEMCDYTHSGNLQLAKRYKNGKLEPNYSEELILGILEGTNFILQEFTLHLLDHHECEKEFEIMFNHFSSNLDFN